MDESLFKDYIMEELKWERIGLGYGDVPVCKRKEEGAVVSLCVSKETFGILGLKKRDVVTFSKVKHSFLFSFPSKDGNLFYMFFEKL